MLRYIRNTYFMIGAAAAAGTVVGNTIGTLYKRRKRTK